MIISELIEKLQNIKNVCGDTEVFLWNNTKMKHEPVRQVYFPVAEDLIMGLKNDKDYMDDFNNVLEHAVII